MAIQPVLFQLRCILVLAAAVALSACALPQRQASAKPASCSSWEIGSRLCGFDDVEYINKGHIDPSVTQRPEM
jgi:hypothetical protein